jgi:hypothetical protein
MLDAARKTSRVTRLQTEKGSKNIMAICTLISIVLSGLTLLLQVLLVGGVITIARKPSPSLVQLADGRAIKVQALGSQERSTDVIQRFVTDSLIMLMGMSNELPNTDGGQKTIDPGAIVKTKQGERRITTSAFQASFTFSDDLRAELVKILADMTPAEVFEGKVKTTLKFQHVTVPVALGNGKWKINVVATLIQYQRGSGETIKIPFNKELTVQTIDTPALPQGGKFSNEIEAVVYSIRQAGLEITSMKDLDSDDATAGDSKSSFIQPSTNEKK